ncbi:MAG: serine/threonine-protein kinase [Verrucomicrobiaceae bacterium]
MCLFVLTRRPVENGTICLPSASRVAKLSVEDVSMTDALSSSRAEGIVLDVQERPAVEREAFIIAACGEDAALLTEVRVLLSAQRLPQAAEIKSEAAVSSSRPAWMAMEREGDRIANYKLLQEIGEGGFGSVWMAEQLEPVSRSVALKIVKLGMDTREVIARFEVERRALAMMDHPNIAKVFDAGMTDSGRPFFVMELVKGLPITTFCDDRQLGTRERLALFADVCAAINHAHQKGVIHRDIKPSNIMVTLLGDKPVVKVIDFGIAKATEGKLTDKTLFTRFEQFIGTPVYMSPEQADPCVLDVDTRCDIYALGILLYELLVGRPPFDAKSLASAGVEEIRRIIREVEPPRPSSRLSTVSGEERTQLARSRRIEPGKLHRLVESDLDWIVMKAIDKERSRRYDTASAFAQDIAHFLADEPVNATPPSAGYQFRKFARRHKAALRVAAAFILVLVGATAISIWQAVRATRERDEKDLARKDAEAITTFLVDAFQSPDPARDGRTITVAETLDHAAKQLESDLATQPAQRAKLQGALGRTYRVLGLAREAIPLQEKARDFSLSNNGPEHPDTLRAMDMLASSYFDAARFVEALRLREEVLRLRRQISGPKHPDTVAAMNNLGASYLQVGRSDAALELSEEVLALRQKALGPEHTDTLDAMNNVANDFKALGRQDDALKLFEKEISLYRKAYGPKHPGTLLAMVNMAIALHTRRGVRLSPSDSRRNEEALKLLEEALPLCRQVLGPEHPLTLKAMADLAISCEDAGRKEETLQWREELLRLRRKALGLLHPDTLLAMNNLAISCAAAGREDDALKLRTEVLPLYRQVLGAEHVRTLDAMSNLAVSYAAAGRLSEAVTLQEESLATMRHVLAPSELVFSVALKNLAEFYDKTGRKAEAVKLRAELKEAWSAYLRGPGSW